MSNPIQARYNIEPMLNLGATNSQKSNHIIHEGLSNKLSDGEASIILELWGMWSTTAFDITPRSTLTWSGST